MSKTKTATKPSPFVTMQNKAGNSVRVPNPVLYEGLPSKSAKIRAMAADIATDGAPGSTNSKIALALNIRPQHAYNVLNTQLKRPTT